MSVDREQVRRYAEKAASMDDHEFFELRTVDLLALLAELEQAERERDEHHKMRCLIADNNDALEAQLAKVPALVDEPPGRASEDWPAWTDNFYRCPNTRAWVYKFAEPRIVAVFEQEQGEQEQKP